MKSNYIFHCVKRWWLSICWVGCLILAVHIAGPGAMSARSESLTKKTNESTPAYADGQTGIIDSNWITEKSGAYLPLDAEFIDSTGKRISLRSIIDKPTLILPIYFYCPNSCSLNLAYLANAVRTSTLKPGVDFRIISFSFNAEEKIEDAMNSKENYMKMLPENFPAEDWKFLIGTKENIQTLIDALGYRVKRMPDGTFVHPSALVVASANGRIIKYVYGSFLSGDVDLALLEAQKGTPASSVKRLLDFCFNSNSQTSDAVLKGFKLGLVLVCLILGGIFVRFLRRGNKKNTTAEER